MRSVTKRWRFQNWNNKAFLYYRILSEVPCRVSSDPHERCNDLRTVLTTDSANNAMAVKMRPTYTRTKRPRGALLQLDIDLFLLTVENRRDPRILRGASGIPLFEISKSNLRTFNRGSGTVSGGQFRWGGGLLKSTANAQRYPCSGWKSEFKCNGRRVLDCDTYK